MSELNNNLETLDPKDWHQSKALMHKMDKPVELTTK